jgi:yeast amino acid transporter
MYDRNHPRYPYKSHGQWLKAAYGMVATMILVVFNGIGPFFENPFDGRTFVASYISVSFLPDLQPPLSTQQQLTHT